MPRIEMLTLANHAEVQNGLMYLSGAEWDTLTRDIPQGADAPPQHLGVGVSVVVGWTETNERHLLHLWIEDEDGQVGPLDVNAELEVGRPAGKVHGSDSRAPFAINAIVTFPGSGHYAVCAQVGSDAPRKYPFRVVDRLVQAQPG
ncbi:MAG: hypothetical protein OXH86_01855 [Acidimicrobiaceae bacterium]|nr:hypothetical protein [Acidimicrobiaceae bacterium]MDE0496073.1 hypothetical protein [Acidimicrobiaceae bacterium]